MSQQRLAVLVGIGDVGLAVARRLHGHRLVIADVDDAALRTTARNRPDGIDAHSLSVDLGDPPQVDELVRLVSRSGTVRHLIIDTNVGMLGTCVESVLRRTWIGPAMVLDALAPLVTAGASGVVICDSSAGDAVIDPYDEEALALLPVCRLPRLEIAAPQRFPDIFAARSFAMRAIQLRTRAVNSVWKHRGARINSLTVGGFGDEGRPVSGVADVGAFLLSEESRCVAGADLLVDGGASVTTGYDGELVAEDLLVATDTGDSCDSRIGIGDLSGRFTRS